MEGRSIVKAKQVAYGNKMHRAFVVTIKWDRSCGNDEISLRCWGESDVASKRSWLKKRQKLAYSFTANLYRFACVQVGNRKNAEHVAQKNYLSAFASSNMIKPDYSIDLRLTVNHLGTIKERIGEISKAGRLATFDMIVKDTELVSALSVSKRHPDSIVEERELDSNLSSALRELSTLFLLPLILKDIQDLSHKEIVFFLIFQWAQ